MRVHLALTLLAVMATESPGQDVIPLPPARGGRAPSEPLTRTNPRIAALDASQAAGLAPGARPIGGIL